MQQDGSLLASGTRPERDTYTLLGPLLEANHGHSLGFLTDPSLPHQGPGRQDNGNLHLSEIEVQINEEAPVLWKSATRRLQSKGLGCGTCDRQRREDGLGHLSRSRKITHCGLRAATGTIHYTQRPSIDPIASTSWRRPSDRTASSSPFRCRSTFRVERLPEGIERILHLRKEDRSQHDRLQLAIHFERQRLHESLESLSQAFGGLCSGCRFHPRWWPQTTQGTSNHPSPGAG